MTKTELIARQAKKLEELQIELKEFKSRIKQAQLYFIGIGGPLNDNKLEFSQEQLALLRSIYYVLKGGQGS